MKYIDIENWNRKKHYEFFKGFDYPQFNLCANINFTETLKFVKDNELSVFKVVLYAVIKAANEIEQFRYRIRGEQVVLHDIIHPGCSIMGEDELFCNCLVDYEEDINKFFPIVADAMVYSKENNIIIEQQNNRDDLLYLSCLPWISFTGLVHPVHFSPADSIPRITWGKYFNDNNQIKMPFSVQVHHSLMDGVHIAKYYSLLEKIFSNPQEYFKINS
ncbi:MAG: chloramphenicol acetyltransferase [bacterium]